MKNIIYTTVFIIAGLAIYAFMNPTADLNTDKKEAIQFHRGSWKEALEIARKENKLIFLDIYATWCGPCKRLKKTTFSDSRVGKYFNSTFVNVSLDGETGEGEILANKYVITAYPTLLFIDKDGNVVVQADGFHDPDELISLARSAVDWKL